MPLRVISNDDYPAVILQIGDLHQPARLGLYMMLWTGIRVGELCKLAWADVALNGMPLGALTVPPYAAKRHTERTVPIPVPLRGEILCALNNWYALHQLTPPSYLMARAPNGKPLSTRAIQRAANDVGRRALHKPLTPHVFRHTYADRLRRVADLTVVQAALGHARISTTAIYTHPTLDDLTAATTKLYGTPQ